MGMSIRKCRETLFYGWRRLFVKFSSLIGLVRFGALWRLQPVSRSFGHNRGKCIDRYYIENFLSCHSNEIAGRVLEVGDDSYTRKYGGNDVTESDVLHACEGNANATIVADLANAGHIQANTFDCIILTQVLSFVYDVQGAVSHLHRILKPGGVLLVTVPGLVQISRYDMDRGGDYWRFTTLSAKRLFAAVFGEQQIQVHSHGNVLVATAFLQGLAMQDLTIEELEHQDIDYQVLITVRAVKE